MSRCFRTLKWHVHSEGGAVVLIQVAKVQTRLPQLSCIGSFYMSWSSSISINCKWIRKQVKVEFLCFKISKSPAEFHFECVQLVGIHICREWDGDRVTDWLADSKVRKVTLVHLPLPQTQFHLKCLYRFSHFRDQDFFLDILVALRLFSYFHSLWFSN